MAVSKPKFIFVTGGVVSSLGKGIAAASIGRLLVARGLSVGLQKFDPYINVDPGHDVALPARRGLRHRGRRRDRPRPRPLRALHEHEHVARVERHRRRHLQLGHPPRAPRRLPRRHRAGRPAHHRRDQAAHAPDRRDERRRRRHHRDRRHRRRHRVAAVPRGDPPVPGRRRPAQLHVHPPDAGALHRPRRRAEDQADAALRQRAAPHRHPARHAALPRRGRALQRHPQEDRALRVARPRVGRLGQGRRQHLQGAALVPEQGVDDVDLRPLRPRRRARRPARVGRDRRPRLQRRAAGAHRARRQVRPARGRLPVGLRGAAPLRLGARRQGRDRLGRLRGALRRGRPPPSAWRRPTASSCPAASAAAAGRARSARRRSPASAGSRTWASAWACTSR